MVVDLLNSEARLDRVVCLHAICVSLHMTFIAGEEVSCQSLHLDRKDGRGTFPVL